MGGLGKISTFGSLLLGRGGGGGGVQNIKIIFSLRIVLKIGASIRKTQRLVKYQEKSNAIIIIVICDVILVNSYIPD